MQKNIIAVDPGKHTCKAVARLPNNGLKHISFRNKSLSIDNTLDMETQGNSYKVIFNGKKYVLGDQGEEIDYNISKTELSHQLATYTAISQLYNKKPIVQLVLGCPVSIYKNKHLREKYKNFILNGHQVNINVQNDSHKFILENILVLPEGCGIIYLHPELFKEKRVAVIDLGGLNMNFTIFDNFVPEISSMFTINHGSNELESTLINTLNSTYGITLNKQDAAHILRQGGLTFKGKLETSSINIVDHVISNYISMLLQEVKRNNYNPDTLSVVFVGGTSLLIKDRLLQFINHSLVLDNAQWCNAEGFLKIGEIKYGKTEANIR